MDAGCEYGRLTLATAGIFLSENLICFTFVEGRTYGMFRLIFFSFMRNCTKSYNKTDFRESFRRDGAGPNKKWLGFFDDLYQCETKHLWNFFLFHMGIFVIFF